MKEGIIQGCGANDRVQLEVAFQRPEEQSPELKCNPQCLAKWHERCAHLCGFALGLWAR